MNTKVKKIKDGRYIFFIVLICSVAYMVSYLTRYNYAAVLVDIIKSEGFSKTQASFPLTAMFVVYGTVQLLSGYLGDKISPERIVFAGLWGACLANIAMPFCTNPIAMTVVWGINGFAQSLMWPPIVKILTEYLTKEDYEKYIIYIMFGTGFGTIFVYCFTPVILKFASWREAFFIPAAIAAVMAIVWIFFIGKIEKHAVETEIYVPEATKNGVPVKTRLTGAAILLLALIMLSNVMQGFVRDGTANWMPTYMDDVFHLGSSLAILTGIALPIASKFVSLFTNIIHRKVLRNEAKTTSLFFAVCSVCCLVLTVAHSSSGVLSVCMLMLVNASSHAVNFMYTTIAVPHFERFGKASFIAGILNSSVYIGSALSTYGIAFIEQRAGWAGVMAAWLAASAIGLAVCLFSVKPFSKKL